MELLLIYPNPAGFIHLQIARFSKAGNLDFHSIQSFATSSETISFHPNSCWLRIWMVFLPYSKKMTQEGHIMNLADSLLLFDSGLFCIEFMHPNVLVSMFHAKPNGFSLWLLGFSNCFRLTFFPTC